MKRYPSKSRGCTHLRKLKITNSDKTNIKSELERVKKKVKPQDDLMKQLAKD